MREAVIVSAARTPFGKFGGALKDLKAVDLGGRAISEALRRSGIAAQAVDEVIFGMVVPAGAGQIPARQAALKAGLPHDIPALTINKVCGSAMKAISLASQIIRSGDADVIVAGGMESMSNIPYTIPAARWGGRMGNSTMTDTMIKDGLWCPENDVHMAVLGSRVAEEYAVTRQQQDAWALRSQQRWAAAERSGFFDAERFPITVRTRKGDVEISRDESPRPDTTLEVLANLKPVFDSTGSVTAGNAPGVNDGAAAVIVTSRQYAENNGLPILAAIRACAQVSQPSAYIATVPGLAIQKLMEKNGLTLDYFDRIEINEAFAAVPLVSGKVLGMSEADMDARVNVNGSAIAVGHPIGASGARLIMTLIAELKRSGKHEGVAAICSGMAQGDAIWLSVE